PAHLDTVRGGAVLPGISPAAAGRVGPEPEMALAALAAGLLLASLVLSLVLELWLTFGRFSGVPVLGTIDALRVGATAQAAFYLPVTRAWEFLAGAVTALTASRWSPRPRSAAGLGV